MYSARSFIFRYCGVTVNARSPLFSRWRMMIFLNWKASENVWVLDREMVKVLNVLYCSVLYSVYSLIALALGLQRACDTPAALILGSARCRLRPPPSEVSVAAYLSGGCELNRAVLHLLQTRHDRFRSNSIRTFHKIRRRSPGGLLPLRPAETVYYFCDAVTTWHVYTISNKQHFN